MEKLEVWRKSRIMGKFWKFGKNVEYWKKLVRKLEIRKKFVNLDKIWEKIGKILKSGKYTDIWNKIRNFEKKLEKKMEIWKISTLSIYH